MSLQRMKTPSSPKTKDAQELLFQINPDFDKMLILIKNHLHFHLNYGIIVKSADESVQDCDTTTKAPWSSG